MKEQLTLEHLAIYLPYELKFKAIGSCNNHEVLGGLESYTVANWSTPVYNDNEPVCTSKIDYSSIWSLKEIKPFLRPLSDLTKEIEVNGEKFVPIDVIKDEFLECDTLIYGDAGYGWIGLYNDNTLIPFYMECDMEIMPEIHYRIVAFLAKWHFDIYGLNSKGLAIDINTL